MHDLRYALRALRRRPAFAAAAILTLALATGATNAIFAVFYQVLLRPLPYRDPERLVFVWNSWKNGSHTEVSIPDYLDRRAEVPAFEDAALIAPGSATLSLSGPPEQLGSARVTGSFFTTLGRGPLLGRVFADQDPADAAAVVLTHAVWQSRFGADAAVIGRQVRINAEPHVVVGVLPADFELPVRDVELLLPFVFTPAQMSNEERGNEFSVMIARLRSGASVPQANAQMQTIVTRLMDRVPARAAYMRNSGFGGAAVPMRDELAGDLRTPLLLLQAGVVIVLLIACANVGNLLLVRAAGRGREVAIRASLGATRGRIAGQLAVEGAVLAFAGCTLGIVIAAAGTRVLSTAIAPQVSIAAAASVDRVSVAFAVAMAAGMTLMFGMVSTLALARRNPSEDLKEGGSRTISGRRAGRLRSALVASEMAFAVVLVVAAGLLLVSLMRVLEVNPGFSTARVLSARLVLAPARYPDAQTQRAAWSRLLEKTAALPGAEAVGLTAALPFGGIDASGTYQVVGRQLGPAEQPPHAFLQTVGGEYFGTLQIPLLEGRVFNDGDNATATRVVVVDEILARRHFPSQSALGHQINFGGPRNYTIVGVVRAVNAGDLARAVAEERIYFNVQQVPRRAMSVLVKSRTGAAALTPSLRAAVQSVDPDQAVFEVRTLDERLSRALQPRRTPALLFFAFAFIAVLLAAVGIYGVVSSAAAERVRDFGIRQALGADRASIMRLVLRQGLSTTFAGMAAGAAGSLLLGRYLEALLFGVSAHEPVIVAGALALLIAVAALATYIPARRATMVDPLVALRDA